MAVASAKKFLRTMAQPFGGKEQDGVSTWSLSDLERHKGKMEEEKIRELMNERHAEGRVYENGGNAEEGYDDADLDAAMMEIDASG